MTNRYIKLSLMVMLLSPAVFGQKFNAPKKGSIVGFSANLVDFSASVPKIGHVDPGISLMYWKGITNKIDFSVRYNALLSYYVKNINTESGKTDDSEGYINEFEGSLHGRLLNDDHLLNPFLTAGIGIGNYGKKTWAPYVPLGGGLQLNMLSEGYIFLQANYRRSLAEKKLDHNMFYSLGFTQAITSKEPELKPVPVVIEEVKDRDNDGVPDITDACPDAAGPSSMNGCPDRDGDKVADKDDKCADVAGLQKYAGCPVPDTDKDGINDEQDKCPQMAGIQKYQGCPVPDEDKDGVSDEEDRCPRLAGTIINHGCPEVKEEVKKKIDKAATNIYFASGKAVLLASSNKSLDEVARILQADAGLKIDINGHTDNTGNADKNRVLSEARAKAVYEYLIKKGVAADKLKPVGFGQDQPVADNKTAAGRAKNRRVEMKLHYD
jgi:OmpA-OmpF porin, OOP family